jgi:type IV pilus assembly protein PilB
MNPPRGPEDSIGSNRTTPHILSGSLHLVVNQRLVRRICEECKREIEMDPEDLLRYGLSEDEARQAKTLFGKGCAACNYTGYRGRIGLFEVLKIDTEIKELLIAGASEETLRQKTGAKTTWTLRQSAMQKLRDGVTTIEEVAREIRL